MPKNWSISYWIDEYMWLPHPKLNQLEFNQRYWRKEAVHISAELPVAEVAHSLGIDELFRLCRNELVESRLISNLTEQYSLELGPFNFSSLPDHSILMIQGLESHLPVISSLLSDFFTFLPRWKIDDVMVSFGHEASSCGPHFDHYDVFLIQVRGTKQWQFDNGGHTDLDLSPHADIRLLSNFTSTRELNQYAGDVLYIPPGTGHWGLASDDCLTLSVGIRNPMLHELISHFADSVSDNLQDMEMLDDAATTDSATMDIHHETTDRISARLNEILGAPGLVQQWFGRYMTELREPGLISLPEHEYTVEEIKHSLEAATSFQCHLATRLAHQSLDDGSLVFINGDVLAYRHAIPTWFKRLVTTRSVLCSQCETAGENLVILKHLYNAGAIYFSNQ